MGIETALLAASLAVSAASSTAGYVGQLQQANAQKSASKATATFIQQSTLTDIAQTQLQGTQENAEASQKAIEAKRQTMQAEARAKVAAGEAGVSGLSVDALLADYQREQDNYDTSLDTTLENNGTQRGLEIQGEIAQGQSRVNSLPLPQDPSPLGTALQIGGSAVDAYGKYGMSDTSQSRLPKQS